MPVRHELAAATAATRKRRSPYKRAAARAEADFFTEAEGRIRSSGTRRVKEDKQALRDCARPRQRLSRQSGPGQYFATHDSGDKLPDAPSRRHPRSASTRYGVPLMSDQGYRPTLIFWSTVVIPPGSGTVPWTVRRTVDVAGLQLESACRQPPSGRSIRPGRDTRRFSIRRRRDGAAAARRWLGVGGRPRGSSSRLRRQPGQPRCSMRPLSGESSSTRPAASRGATPAWPPSSRAPGAPGAFLSVSPE